MISFAFQSAIVIAVFYALLYGKGLLTSYAGFGDVIGLSGGVITVIAAIFFATLDTGLRAIEWFTALKANQLLASSIVGMIALGTTEMAFSGFKHVWLYLMRLTTAITGNNHGVVSFIQSWLLLYQKWQGYAWVYNLEVEDIHEYYAFGILVHNCENCRSLHGVVGSVTTGWISPLDGMVYYEMAHPGCRCFRRPVVPGVDRSSYVARVIELPRRRLWRVA